jgi:hypothetical protein
MNLEKEAQRATQMLKHKVFDVLRRHHKGEVVIQFTDGTRLFVDQQPDGLELSITENVDKTDRS